MANTINKAKTHCPNGHPYIERNLVLSALKRGRRSCKTCRKIGDKRRRNPDGNISPAVLNSQKKFCKNEHELLEPNLVKSELKRGKRVCKICKNEYNKIRAQKPKSKKYKADWISKNRSKSRAYSKKWRDVNPEKAKLWDKTHPEQVRQRQKKHEKNPERIAYRRKWQKIDYEKNPEKTLQKNIRQLEKLGKPLDMSSREYKRAIQSWSKTAKKTQLECAICKIRTNLKSHHIFYKSNYPTMSLMKNNVIVLCKQHHYEVHGMNIKSKSYNFYKKHQILDSKLQYA